MTRSATARSRWPSSRPEKPRTCWSCAESSTANSLCTHGLASCCLVTVYLAACGCGRQTTFRPYPGRLRYFGDIQQNLKRRYVLVVDKSGSMEGSNWKEAEEVTLLTPHFDNVSLIRPFA